MSGVVQVIFSRRAQLGSLAIRTITWSDWSHCGIIDPETGTVIEALMFEGVTDRRTVDEFKAAASKSEIVEIPCDDPAAVIAAARSRIGQGYDWLGVLGWLLRLRLAKDSYDFCSELIAWAFAVAGSPLFRTDAWRIAPRDIYIRTY